MVLLGGGKPHSIVCGLVAFVAQYEDNLVLNVDREAAEHGTGLGRECGDRLQHELMRDSLALFDGEERLVRWERAYISMRTRHRTHGRIPGFSYREKIRVLVGDICRVVSTGKALSGLAAPDSFGMGRQSGGTSVRLLCPFGRLRDLA